MISILPAASLSHRNQDERKSYPAAGKYAKLQQNVLEVMLL